MIRSVVNRAQSMSRDAITFILEGSSARNGNIPADVFISKLKQFVSTIYSFDRSFAGKAKRSIELEVFDLRKVNPAFVLFNPRTEVRGYDAAESVSWAMHQFASIAEGGTVDPRVSQETLDNVIDLARVRKAKLPLLQSIRAQYRDDVAKFDEAIAGRAMALRATRDFDKKAVWQAGVSRGPVFGELNGVTDLNGEKTFWIITPSGKHIQCLFPEALRHEMGARLWTTVRVHGFLRYDGRQPEPYLIEAERIEAMDDPGRPHLSDMKGAFSSFDELDSDELV